MLKLVRRTYDWVLRWADTRYGPWALFVLAFAEASFFPIPPDVLLIALAVSMPTRAFRYALIVTTGSVLGGVLGYAIGFYFMGAFGNGILELYGLSEGFNRIGDIYKEHDAWAVAISGFTPIPYKLFTIGAGVFKIDLWVFIFASIIGRALRFFIIATVIYFYGESIKNFIERYFNIITIVATALVVLGFVVIKMI